MEKAAREFDALIAEFYEVWFRFHPAEALRVGISGYEGGFPAVNDDDIGALGVWLESSIVALEELDYNALDEDRKLDLELLFLACRDEHQALLEYDWRHRDPVRFLPVRSLHQLVLVPGLAFRGILELFLGRIPEYLRLARSQLATFPTLIPLPWVEAAIVESAAGVEYLGEFRDGALLKKRCSDPVRARELCDQASHALTAYSHFLEQEIVHRAQGLAGCGQERFEQRMWMCHALRVDSQQLLDILKSRYEQTLEELQQLSRSHNGDRDPVIWMDRVVGSESLEADRILDFAREQNSALKDFIQSGEIFDIPSDSRLRVETPPGCYSPGFCAPSYVTPAPGDPEITGIIYLSPGERLRESITAQCIRSGWAGYHLQAVTASHSSIAGNLVRRLVSSATIAEGWKYYAENLLFEQGFAATPEQSLMRLSEKLRRTSLAILDIQLHVNGLETESALAQLEALPGMSPERAAVDLMGVTRRPTEALATALGWHLLEILREQREQLDSDFVPRIFHRQLLAQGSIAAPLLIRRCFGLGQWERVRNRLGLGVVQK